MTGEVSVEATGETVGEAKWAAARELERVVPGLDRETIRFQVVSEGERGLLGVGYTPARVIATGHGVEPAPASAASDPADESLHDVVRGLLERTLQALGTEGTVTIEEGDELVATLVGPDLGLVIGRHGQMIDALQVIANAAVHHRFGDARPRVVVDAADYRARRAETLLETARRAAERAAAVGHDIALEPMSSAERRIVHEALKDDPEVETASEGSEPNRYVVVAPRRTTD